MSVYAKLPVRGLRWIVLGFSLWVPACTQSGWNSPYPGSQADANSYYDFFSERPRHLDPVRSYSSDEYEFIAQIYEPPLQYHFLHRPYKLVPLTAVQLPEQVHLDADQQPLPANTDPSRVVYSRYRIRIAAGIRYQPHPALARDAAGHYRYHALSAGALEDVHVLADFAEQGSRELTAADYVYQVKRMAHPDLHCPIAGLLERYLPGLGTLREQLVRDRRPGQWLDLRDYGLEGVRVVDRYTFEFTLQGLYPQFLYWLAMPFFAPMPWEAERFYSQPGMAERNLVLDWYPLGTGPFMLTENDPNLRMVLERNPYFRGEPYPDSGAAGDAALLVDAGRPMPFIERAIYTRERESIPAWNKFLQGYYDTSGIGSDSFEQVVSIGEGGNASLSPAMQERGMRLLTAITASQFYMGFNMRDAVVGGLEQRARLLRQAISIAVDYEEYISIFLNGRGMAAQGPVPPGIFGHRPGAAGVNAHTHHLQDGRVLRHSIVRARELLARAGYPGGIDPATGRALVLYFDTVSRGPDSRAQLAWQVKQFARLGIELVVRGTDYNRFRGKMQEGNAQIFQWGWNADYPDPENFLFLLYGPNSKVVSGGENTANYANPQFDRLFERMRILPNQAERQQLIDEMIDIARHDAPWVWGFHPQAYSLHHAWFHNAKPNLMANNTLKYKRISPALRAQSIHEWNQPLLWPLGVLVLIPVLLWVLAARTLRGRAAATGQ